MVSSKVILFSSLLQTSEATIAACAHSTPANGWISSSTGTCPSGSTAITTSVSSGRACTAGGDASQPDCAQAACCQRSCSDVAWQITACDAGTRLKTGTDWTTLCDGISSGLTPEVGYAYDCDKSLCCEANTGAVCSDSASGMQKGYCGSGKEYDSSKASNKCKAATSGACVSGDATDIHACCKDTAGQKCSEGDFATVLGKCNAGYSYKTALANLRCVLSTACDTTDLDDLNTCCSVNTGSTCSDSSNGATEDGWCPAGQTYDSTKANNKCKDSRCDSNDADDQKACCSAGKGDKCSKVVGTDSQKDGWCPAGKTYDTAKANNLCKTGTCDKRVVDDQNACCSTTKGSQNCETGFAKDGQCSKNRPGYTYKSANKALLCVGDTCDPALLDDTNTCCMATTGITCKEAGIGPGFCGSGYMVDKDKEDNKCRGTDSCDSTRQDDINTCCKSNPGPAKCGNTDAEGGAMAKGFCGAGMEYDDSKANSKCVGDKCSGASKDDVKTCCKALAGEGKCGAISSPTFCGAGKHVDPDKSETACSGKNCLDTNKDDTNTCCKDNEGATCGDAQKGAMGAGFCGLGNSYNSANSGKKCKADPCVKSQVVDTNTCCQANAGDLCSTITKISNFCGTTGEYDTTKANRKCSTSPCTSTADDKLECCKVKVVTTTKKKTVVTKTNNSSTPGQTGSAHTKSACAVFVILGCLSHLIV